MPTFSRITRGKVLAALPPAALITTAALEQALEENAGEDPRTIKKYIGKLETLGDIERIAGGWQLSEKSRQKLEIIVTIRPGQHHGDIMRAITEAIKPFGRIATMEIQA